MTLGVMMIYLFKTYNKQISSHIEIGYDYKKIIIIPFT
jgi:hypothetical protein